MKGQLFCEIELYNLPCKIYLITTEKTNFAKSIATKDLVEIYLGVIGDFENLFESLLHELEEGYNWLGNIRFIPIDCEENLQWTDCKFEYDHKFFQQRCSKISRLILSILPLLREAHLQLNS